MLSIFYYVCLSLIIILGIINIFVKIDRKTYFITTIVLIILCVISVILQYEFFSDLMNYFKNTVEPFVSEYLKVLTPKLLITCLIIILVIFPYIIIQCLNRKQMNKLNNK
jgi:hypothetical protein